jgi:hypothetical protein
MLGLGGETARVPDQEVRMTIKVLQAEAALAQAVAVAARKQISTAVDKEAATVAYQLRLQEAATARAKLEAFA